MIGVLGKIWNGPRGGRYGLVLSAILLAAAILGPLLAPYDPAAMDATSRFASPSREHLLGTDSLGRDVLTRILYGSRLSISIALGAVLIAATIGHVFGMAAGYLGGAVDMVIGRVTDMFFAIPDLLLAIGIIALLGRNQVTVSIAVGVGFSPLYVRIVRSAVIQAKSQDFVRHAQALGMPWYRILRRDIFPTMLPTTLVQSTMMLGFAILNEAGLGFLGIGVQPPTASWGSMLSEGRRFLIPNPMFVVYVGAALAIAVFGFNLLSDGLKGALDPRTAVRRPWSRRKART